MVLACGTSWAVAGSESKQAMAKVAKWRVKVQIVIIICCVVKQ
jgi:hypothetical protein